MKHFRKSLIVLLISSAFVMSLTAQDERPPAEVPPLEQLVYASEGRLEMMTFYADYSLTIDYLSDPAILFASEPEISDNGHSMAFVGLFNDQVDVFLLEAAFHYRQLTNTPAWERNLQWSGTTRLSFAASFHQLSEANLVMVDVFDSSATVLAVGVANCCHRWLDSSHVALNSLKFDEPIQLSLNEPHVILPYEGLALSENAVTAQARAVLPDVPYGILIESRRSPMENLWYGIYSVWDPVDEVIYEELYVTDRDGVILAQIKGVNEGNADWRNLNGYSN
jgi:hypothetical protein